MVSPVQHEHTAPPFLEEFSHNSHETRALLGNVAVQNEADSLDTPTDAHKSTPVASEVEPGSENITILQKISTRLRTVHERIMSKLLGRKSAAQLETIEIGAEDVSMEKVENLRPFYEEQVAAWKNAPYNAEELRTYFSVDHLKSLSVEDYGLLMSRFPGEMVTHVTRQGVRDHSGMVYHTEGLGAYADGFKSMLRAQHLRSPLGVYMFEREKDEAVADALHLDRYPDEQAAREGVEAIFHADQGEKGSYVDKTAIHFAAEEAASEYYGSEAGNEIFVAYPTAMIASQYYFNGNVTTPKIGDQWNDVWVWNNEEEGIPLDAGLIFIPKDTPVSGRTGSRYELDEANAPLPNKPVLDTLSEILHDEHFDDVLNEFVENYPRTNSSDAIDVYKQKYRDRLVQEYGVSEPGLQNIILDRAEVDTWRDMWRDAQSGSPLSEYHEAIIGGLLSLEGLQYTPAKDAIPAEQYWEDYFKQTGWRPSKVVYYEGNPTEALNDWRVAHDVHKRSSSNDLGFGREIDRNHEAATKGLDRFRDIAYKVVDEHFKKKPDPLETQDARKTT